MGLSRRTQQRLVTFVMIGIVLAIITSLGPWQALVLGVGLVSIGTGVILQRRRRPPRVDGPGDGSVR